MSAKADLLRDADVAFAELRLALASLPDVAMERPWLGTWAVREILIHVTAWHREMIPALARIARGERPLPDGVSYADVDGWNARHVIAHRGLTVQGVRAMLEVSHREFLAAAGAIPDARFEPGRAAARIVDLNGPHHYRDHADQIRAWRRREGI